MRSLAFTATGAERFSEWAALCCSCGLCTLFACPEELYPKEACDDSKAVLRAKGWKWTGATQVEVHPMHDGRRVPIKSLSISVICGLFFLTQSIKSASTEP